MLIHMLNLLIAIMGDTFAQRTPISKEIMIQNHLKFIIDNFHLMSLSFTDISKVKYVMCAFYSQVDNKDEAQAFTQRDVKLMKDDLSTVTALITRPE